MARQKKTEYINAVNVWLNTNSFGEYDMSVEYVDSEPDVVREIFKSYKTRNAQLKAAAKYGEPVNIL